jgi:hypothetical protein
MADPGLCGLCRHARVAENRRGSVFWRCDRSRTDPRFPRYPGLPVLRCAGFAPVVPAGGARPDGDAAIVQDRTDRAAAGRGPGTDTDRETT